MKKYPAIKRPNFGAGNLYHGNVTSRDYAGLFHDHTDPQRSALFYGLSLVFALTGVLGTLYFHSWLLAAVMILIAFFSLRGLINA